MPLLLYFLHEAQRRRESAAGARPTAGRAVAPAATTVSARSIAAHIAPASSPAVQRLSNDEVGSFLRVHHLAAWSNAAAYLRPGPPPAAVSLLPSPSTAPPDFTRFHSSSSSSSASSSRALASLYPLSLLDGSTSTHWGTLGGVGRLPDSTAPSWFMPLTATPGGAAIAPRMAGPQEGVRRGPHQTPVPDYHRSTAAVDTSSWLLVPMERDREDVLSMVQRQPATLVDGGVDTDEGVASSRGRASTSLLDWGAAALQHFSQVRGSESPVQTLRATSSLSSYNPTPSGSSHLESSSMLAEEEDGAAEHRERGGVGSPLQPPGDQQRHRPDTKKFCGTWKQRQEGGTVPVAPEDNGSGPLASRSAEWCLPPEHHRIEEVCRSNSRSPPSIFAASWTPRAHDDGGRVWRSPSPLEVVGSPTCAAVPKPDLWCCRCGQYRGVGRRPSTEDLDAANPSSSEEKASMQSLSPGGRTRRERNAPGPPASSCNCGEAAPPHHPYQQLHPALTPMRRLWSTVSPQIMAVMIPSGSSSSVSTAPPTPTTTPSPPRPRSSSASSSYTERSTASSPHSTSTSASVVRGAALLHGRATAHPEGEGQREQHWGEENTTPLRDPPVNGWSSSEARMQATVALSPQSAESWLIQHSIDSLTGVGSLMEGESTLNLLGKSTHGEAAEKNMWPEQNGVDADRCMFLSVLPTITSWGSSTSLGCSGVCVPGGTLPLYGDAGIRTCA